MRRRLKGRSRRDDLLRDVLINNNDEHYEISEVSSQLLYGYSKDRGMRRAAALFKSDIPKKRGPRR